MDSLAGIGTNGRGERPASSFDHYHSNLEAFWQIIDPDKTSRFRENTPFFIRDAILRISKFVGYAHANPKKATWANSADEIAGAEIVALANRFDAHELNTSFFERQSKARQRLEGRPGDRESRWLKKHNRRR